jgi:4-aminobutyrate aminotransferase-like enzyme
LLAREDLLGFNAAEEHTTFGSNPVAFAAALATIEVMLRTKLPERSRMLGERATARLLHLQEEHALIGEVRGSGLFIGVELVEDPRTRAPATERAAALVELAMMNGVIFDVDMPEVECGTPTCRNTIKIKPPLTIQETQLDRALDVFEEMLKQVEQMDADSLAMVRAQIMKEAVPDRKP